MPVEHGAVHRGEGVAGDDGGLDGQLLDVRFGLLRRGTRQSEKFSGFFFSQSDLRSVPVNRLGGGVGGSPMSSGSARCSCALGAPPASRPERTSLEGQNRFLRT